MSARLPTASHDSLSLPIRAAVSSVSFADFVVSGDSAAVSKVAGGNAPASVCRGTGDLKGGGKESRARVYENTSAAHPGGTHHEMCGSLRIKSIIQQLILCATSLPTTNTPVNAHNDQPILMIWCSSCKQTEKLILSFYGYYEKPNPRLYIIKSRSGGFWLQEGVNAQS